MSKQNLSFEELSRRAERARQLIDYQEEVQSSSKWSFLCSNPYLRTVLKARFDSQKDLSYRKLATLMRVTSTQIHDYFSRRQRKPLTDFQLYNMAEILGFSLKLEIDLLEDE